MSNKVIIITQIATVLTILGGIYGFYRMMVQHIVQKKDATIELLKEKNTWLEKQLEAAKETTADVLLERYYKRIEMLESEISKLSKDDQANRVNINLKQAEIDLLNALIEQSRERLEEYAEKASRVDECPICQAPLSSMNSFEPDGLGDIVTNKSYACGFSETEGDIETLCPFDSRFPRLEDFEIKTQYLEEVNSWRCTAKPKTRFAKFLPLFVEYGETEEQVKQKMANAYKYQEQLRLRNRELREKYVTPPMKTKQE